MPRILVVEDNEDLRQILGQLLGKEHEVHTAGTGEHAVQLAEQVRPQLVLLDLQLPDMDGIAAGRRIKQALGDDVPILMLTALGEQVDRQAVLTSGCCDAFLVKPVPFATILDQVARLLDGRREAV